MCTHAELSLNLKNNSKRNDENRATDRARVLLLPERRPGIFPGRGKAIREIRGKSCDMVFSTGTTCYGSDLQHVARVTGDLRVMTIPLGADQRVAAQTHVIGRAPINSGGESIREQCFARD